MVLKDLQAGYMWWCIYFPEQSDWCRYALQISPVKVFSTRLQCTWSGNETRHQDWSPNKLIRMAAVYSWAMNIVCKLWILFMLWPQNPLVQGTAPWYKKATRASAYMMSKKAANSWTIWWVNCFINFWKVGCCWPKQYTRRFQSFGYQSCQIMRDQLGSTGIMSYSEIISDQIRDRLKSIQKIT